MASTLSLCPYILPTTIRAYKDNVLSKEVKFDMTHHIGYLAGLLSGFALDVAQVIGYSYAVEHDQPEVLLIPVATNLASGAYEIGRKIYNNTKQKMIDRRNTEGLESTLE